MADLESLIRVRKYEVDEKQKLLAALYKQADDLKDQRDVLETQLAIEGEKAQGMDAEFLRYFLPYSENVKRRIEEIDLVREQMETKIEFAQDDMREAFTELKKVGIIDDRRKAEALAELGKKEAAELDEIANNMFKRNNEDD